MLSIPVAAVPVVAGETRAMLTATDQALLAHAQLFAAVIEGARDSDAPIQLTQRLYSRIAAHGGKLIEGREDLQRLIAELTAVHAQSDQHEIALGCPGGAPTKKSGEDSGDGIFTGANLKGDGQPA
ncbi:hypothetical protein [Sphingomonas soli]|uniref:hypothetical protein n=1 Tax=Sphingomonas soli TaxID=266127 RepID=UPI000836162E|nr:hypothetical protein [Sphingomonas soli]